MTPDAIERERLLLQTRLDATTSREDRNRLGQFSTPPDLADQIVEQALQFGHGGDPIQFLDPAFGTGVFLSALLRTVRGDRPVVATGFEVDPVHGDEAARLWFDMSLDLRIEDFTLADPPAFEDEKPNLIICNPPYLRNQRIPSAEKRRLQRLSADVTGIEVSPLAGLHIHFMLLSHAWLAADGIAAWLLPGELLDVDHGAAVRTYLTQRVTLLRVHRFEPRDLQFDGPKVSSCIAWYRNSRPAPDHVVEMTAGGSVSDPDLQDSRPLAEIGGGGKWNGVRRTVGRSSSGPTLDDLFTIRRGIATGANDYFILPEERAAELGLPHEFLRPVLPPPRLLTVDEILADEDGRPLIEPRLLLLDCQVPMWQLEADHPDLWSYLRYGEEIVASHALCRRRGTWYFQERREASPFLFTYMARPGAGRRPFSFVLNHSDAIATNAYLTMHPRRALREAMAADPELGRRVWEALKAIPLEDLIAEGRTYGRGLIKLEPRELGRVRGSLDLD